MKKAKKNNKGFSLVELIVVVLIIGVIGIALAPQVMKWVDTAKENSDKNAAATLKSSVQAALADWQADGGSLDVIDAIEGDKAIYYIDDKNFNITKEATSNGKNLSDYIKKTVDELPEANKELNSGNDFYIEIDKNGKVTVDCAANTTTPVPSPGV